MTDHAEIIALQDLYRYTWWANDLILDAAAEIPEVELTHVVGGSFPTLWATLRHMAAADWVWLRRWMGEPRAPLPNGWPGKSFASLRAEWAAVRRDQEEILRSISPADLARAVKYLTANDEARELTLAQSMRHVANHSTYHRGQAATFLRRLGGKPPATDLCVFYADGAA